MTRFFLPGTGDALGRSEMAKGELEFEMNRLRREEASLRDAGLKLHATIEALGQEKLDLNRSYMQVRMKKSSCRYIQWTMI